MFLGYYTSLSNTVIVHIFFDLVPPVPITGIIQYFKRFIDSFKRESKAKLFFCFDGNRHPMKRETNTKRQNKRDAALNELNQLNLNANREDITKADKLRTKLFYPREDMIALII